MVATGSRARNLIYIPGSRGTVTDPSLCPSDNLVEVEWEHRPGERFACHLNDITLIRRPSSWERIMGDA